MTKKTRKSTYTGRHKKYYRKNKEKILENIKENKKTKTIAMIDNPSKYQNNYITNYRTKINLDYQYIPHISTSYDIQNPINNNINRVYFLIENNHSSIINFNEMSQIQVYERQLLQPLIALQSSINENKQNQFTHDPFLSSTNDNNDNLNFVSTKISLITSFDKVSESNNNKTLNINNDENQDNFYNPTYTELKPFQSKNVDANNLLNYYLNINNNQFNLNQYPSPFLSLNSSSQPSSLYHNKDFCLTQIQSLSEHLPYQNHA
jgi:hypothetical protein